MVDPVSGGIALASAWIAKEGVGKILGPTFDYMGDGLKDLVQQRHEKTEEIFENAQRKLGDKINKPGKVPPKVFKTLINDASFSTDPLAVEYFGGVLASSRTELGRDDRGDRYAKIVDGLSAYQLRAHYLIYATLSKTFSNQGKSLSLSKDRRQLQLFIPYEDFVRAMDLIQEEINNPQLLHHIFSGLSSDGLIEGTWQFGDQDNLKALFRGAPSDGIICQPSTQGAELYLWAHGVGDKFIDHIVSGELSGGFAGLPEGVQNALSTNLKNTSQPEVSNAAVKMESS